MELAAVSAIVSRAEEFIFGNGKKSSGAAVIEPELELRMGTLSPDGRFCPGVPAELFASMYLKFPMSQDEQSYMPWFADEGIKQTFDYFYTAGDDETIRDRVHFVGGGGAGESNNTQGRQQILEHIAKKTVCLADIELTSSSSSEEDDEEPTPLVFRVALATEHTRAPNTLPSSTRPTLVRLKHTHSFRYTPRDMDQECWRFIFTQVWVGKTTAEAETAFKLYTEAPAVHEVEIECLMPIHYRQHRRENHEYVAESLLQKALSMVAPVDADDPVQYIKDRMANSLRLIEPSRK